MIFNDAFNLLIGNEGGYSSTYSDSGNWTGGKVGVGILKGTKYGISAATYPQLDIHYLTLEQAKQIYQRDFWDCFEFDANKIPECVRFDLFDIAVQTSAPGRPYVPRVILQKALGVNPDGVIGPITKQALLDCDAQKLDKRLTAQKIFYLAKLSDEKWNAFGRGWMRRLANNLMVD